MGVLEPCKVRLYRGISVTEGLWNSNYAFAVRGGFRFYILGSGEV